MLNTTLWPMERVAYIACVELYNLYYLLSGYPCEVARVVEGVSLKISWSYDCVGSNPTPRTLTEHILMGSHFNATPRHARACY